MSKETATSFALPVRVGGSAVMFVSNPRHEPHIEWSLRYSGNLNDPKGGRFSAAAIVESFDYLLSDNINMTEATRRLRLLRAAVRAHVSGVQGLDPAKFFAARAQDAQAMADAAGVAIPQTQQEK